MAGGVVGRVEKARVEVAVVPGVRLRKPADEPRWWWKGVSAVKRMVLGGCSPHHPAPNPTPSPVVLPLPPLPSLRLLHLIDEVLRKVADAEAERRLPLVAHDPEAGAGREKVGDDRGSGLGDGVEDGGLAVVA